MHRFHLPPGECHEPVLRLTDREAHHGLHVLRLERGEKVTVLDGAGHEYLCEVAQPGKNVIELRILDKKWIERDPWQITLVQAIPKGKVFDSIVQKATELGAFSIVPLLTERTVTQLNSERAGNKVAHWQQTAVEAIKQCGSAWLSKVESPITLKEFAAGDRPFDFTLVASLQDGSRHPREWLAAYGARHGAPPRSLAVWVGPEGDFTPEEMAIIEKTGTHPITLGRWVLRSETAAIYCLSVLNSELQFANAPSESR